MLEYLSMQSRTPNWTFSPNFNFGSDSVFTLRHNEAGTIFPPTNSLIITETNDYVITEITSENMITE